MAFAVFTLHQAFPSPSENRSNTTQKILLIFKELKDTNLAGAGRSMHLQELYMPKGETFRLMHTYPCNHTQMLKAAPEPS